MQPHQKASSTGSTNLPAPVSQFKSYVSEVGTPEKLKIAMKYYIDTIAPEKEKFSDTYKIFNDLGAVIQKIEPLSKNFFNSNEDTDLMFKFLEESFKYYRNNKKTNKAIFSIIMNVTKKDDTQILKSGTSFLQTALDSQIFYPYMFTLEPLAQTFQNCFCFNPNTILYYGPLILSATSSKVFTNIANLTQFMEKVKELLNDGNIEPKSSLSALTFIGLIVRHLDTGNFLPEILPYIIEIAPLCDSLSFFRYYLQSPTNKIGAVWQALTAILSDLNMTKELLNSAIIAIDQSGKVPQSKDFSIKPFVQRFNDFTKDQQNLVYAFVRKCPPDIKADFISSSMPLSQTKVDVKFISEISHDTGIVPYIPSILSNFVIKPDISEFETCDISIFEIIGLLIKQTDDSYQPSQQLFDSIMQISIHCWNDKICSVLDSIFIKMNAETFMPSLVKYLKAGLDDPILKWLCSSVNFSRFLYYFLENDGASTFPQLMKTAQGRDLIARLAYFRPNDAVNDFFVKNPPTDLSEHEIDLLMHGLPHNVNKEDECDGYLCIPSLIPYVSSFSLKTPLEKYIVGEAVGKFFQPLREQMKQYVSTYFSSAMLRYQITDPDFLPCITDPNLPHFNVLQSTPIEMAKPSKFKRSASFGFWFNIFELKNNITTIVRFNEGSLKVDGNSYARIGGEKMFISPKQWHFVVILTSGENNEKMTFYIDKKLFTSYKITSSGGSSDIPFFSFGNSGQKSMIYFLSPYLRFLNTIITQDQINMFYQMGPNSPTNVLIESCNGVHNVVSDGLPKYLSTVGGPFFVFYVAMDTTTMQQFMYCLEAAFNLLELGFLEKPIFISSLRFILKHKNHFEDEVIQLLRERIVSYFDISDICLLLNDYEMLMSKAESLITVAPLDDSESCVSHFFYLIEAFCFLDLTSKSNDGNAEESQEEIVFNVITYFIQYDPSYIRRIFGYLYALPHLDQKKLKSIDDEKQYYRQQKLLNLIFQDYDLLFSALSFENIISAFTRLNPKIGSEALLLLAQMMIELNDFSCIDQLQKNDAFLYLCASQEKTWLSIFIILTGETGFKSFDALYHFVTNQEVAKKRRKSDAGSSLKIVHEEVLIILFKLIADSINTNKEFSYKALQMAIDLIHNSEISLHLHVKAVQYLCGLGFGQNPKMAVSFTQQRSSLSPSSINSPFRRRASVFPQGTNSSLEKMKSPSFDVKPVTHVIHTPPSPHSPSQNSSVSFKTNNDLLKSQQSEKYKNCEQKVIAAFDPSLSSRLSNFIFTRQVSEDAIEIPPKQLPNIPSEEEFNNGIIKLIIDLAIEVLIMSLPVSNEFISNLLYLSAQGNDVNSEITILFHQKLILGLLGSHGFREEIEQIKTVEDSLSELFSFLSYRIVEGWWRDKLLDLFDAAIPHLLNIISKSSNLLGVSNFIIGIFLYSNQNKETLKGKMNESKLSELFKEKLPLDYNAYLRIIGENMNDPVSASRNDEFTKSANKNILFMKKERNEIAFKPFDKERIAMYKRQIIDSLHCRKLVRYQFFWHLNLSSLFEDKAISLIHIQRLKTKFTLGIPDKFMVATSSSPLCVPTKLMPCVFSYENRCQKLTKLIDIPYWSQKSPYKSYIPELNIEATAPNCFTGWKIPIFVNFHFVEFAKAAFKGISAPFKAQILGTPESCHCVIVLSEKEISIILNCNLSGKTPKSENLCHYPLFEETMAGYLGTPSIVFNKPAFSIPLSQITMVLERRYVHSNCAVDFFTISGIQISLVTKRPEQRTQLVNHLKPKYTRTAKTGPLYAKHLLEKSVTDVSKKWSRETISTLQYLLYLNSVGNRSFNDYSQYPVFPWIVKDYQTDQFPPPLRDLSKPMGQISPGRTARFDKVFEETNKGYFYGTHYSYPASVLHYMMRIEPFTIFNVVLHSGFDHRDRLFSSISETWSTCSETNPTDIKELIPQFFCFPSMFENTNRLLLQTRSDGTDINDVRLPPWAPTATGFIFRHRQILESNKLCKTLPSWIDLIFGYKQRGSPAVEAKNVYLPISYDSPDKEYENLSDADKDTILNFGQCPLQVLLSPQPSRSSQVYPNIQNSFTQSCILCNINALDQASIVNSALLDSKKKSSKRKKEHQHDEEWRVTYFDHVLYFSTKLRFKIGNQNLNISERQITFNNHILNHDTLINVVDAVVSRDQTLLTVITSFGKIDTYSLLYDNIEFVSSTCLPDIIPLVAVDVSSQYGMIVVASETHLAVVDLNSGFLLSKLHGEYDKVAFDDTNDLIIATSSKSHQVSVFSHRLDPLCHLYDPQKISKSNLSTSESSLIEDVTAIATTDSNNWDPFPYFVTGHQNGLVNVWKIDPSELGKATLTFRTLVKTDHPITSVVIFARGKAVAYTDTRGNVGVVSCCQKNKRPILKSQCFDKCFICNSALQKPYSFCSVCGLPCCRQCLQKNATCSRCADISLSNNGSFMLYDVPRF